MAATGGNDMAELNKADPEMASAVHLKVEQEEKDEGEIKLDLNKQVVCIYISINLPFMPLCRSVILLDNAV